MQLNIQEVEFKFSWNYLSALLSALAGQCTVYRRTMKLASIYILRPITLLILTICTSASPVSRLNNNGKFVSKSLLGAYRKAAVAAIGPGCAQIGSDIMQYKNGSAVDAAIASLLCEGVVTLHNMGLGGGFLMTIYDAPSGESAFLDARETAPGLANSTMYGGNANSSLYGGLAVAVPGEFLGYWEAHQRYGRVPWRELFQPAIKLCENGAIVTKYLESNLKSAEDFIRRESSLAEILINPKTNEIFTAGERIRRPELAKTLRKLADAPNPAHVFYNGSIAKHLVEEIQSFGGIITRKDFSSYRVKWDKPIESTIGNMTMYTAPPPGSGAILTFMINVLNGFVPVEDSKIMWQRIIETYKWAYAKRTELADPDFVDIHDIVANLTSQDFASAIRSIIEDDKTYNDPKHYGAVTSIKEDHGTGQISILAPDGSAVSVTTTINMILGAKIRSKSTGIIFNDEMDDFSSPGIVNGFHLPPSPNNYIEPHKRPFSSMAPTIILDENRKVRLVLGGAGGTKITTTIASIMILHLWNNYTIKEAIDAYRVHHQLFPMKLVHERDFSPEVLNYMHEIGHNLTLPAGLMSAITAVAYYDGQITANSDYRREGTTAGF